MHPSGLRLVRPNAEALNRWARGNVVSEGYRHRRHAFPSSPSVGGSLPAGESPLEVNSAEGRGETDPPTAAFRKWGRHHPSPSGAQLELSAVHDQKQRAAYQTARLPRQAMEEAAPSHRASPEQSSTTS